MRNAPAPYKFAHTARAVRAKKQNKKILRKYGLHEAPPKPQFEEYYGIFRPEHFQNCQGKPHILSVNGCLLNQNTTTNNREC